MLLNALVCLLALINCQAFSLSVERVLIEPEKEVSFLKDIREVNIISGENDYDRTLEKIPQTSFTCEGRKEGFYADVETDCKVFHDCMVGANGRFVKHSYMCGEGTLFSDRYCICNWSHEVDCGKEDHYLLYQDQ